MPTQLISVELFYGPSRLMDCRSTRLQDALKQGYVIKHTICEYGEKKISEDDMIKFVN